jgi:hypothetical protein
MSPLARMFVAAGCFSAWLTVLLLGHPLGAWIHLLGLAAVAVFPWRAARSRPPAEPSQLEESES